MSTLSDLLMKTITPNQLNEWKKAGKEFQLVDIREEHEVAEEMIGGMHIPMDEVIARVSELSTEKPVVIHCKSGKRSAALVHLLERKYSFTNVFTLEGGILGYLDQIK
jgi:rhodanese-related sulfurtransferase